ncbi:MAG TPA: adenosylcobinamide-GDP ribazoletransferase [Acidobacteriota bacterium]|nr:adenosylcobinamide-GDP ribazoletransferase [Acidobacteriota bacterium]
MSLLCCFRVLEPVGSSQWTFPETDDMVVPFLLAVQFLTRIPVPLRQEPSPSSLRWSTAFYPLVGGLVGLACATVFSAALWALPASVAALAAVATGILLTGALHEDGLADYADSLGVRGGRQRKLEVMRDSRIGVFGTLALIIAVGGQVLLLASLPPLWAWHGLILAHLISRMAALLAGHLLTPARSDGLGRSLALRTGALQILLGLATCAAAVWWTQGWIIITALVLPWPLVLLLGLHARLRLGGLTGDVLGAIIVVFHLATYLGLALHLGRTP